MENEILEYSRMIVPSSMRSQYWKYFGFPSDSYNNIVTKKKIICTLCNSAIAYNKNTTNLRTHLVAKHPEVLLQLNLEKRAKRSSTAITNINGSGDGGDPGPGDDVGCSTALIIDNSLTAASSEEIESENKSPDVKRQKLSLKLNEEGIEENGDLKCDSIQLKLTNVNSIIEALTTSADNDLIEKTNDTEDENVDTDYQEYANNFQSDYEIEEIDTKTLKVDANFSEVLLDMLIKDLHSPAFIEGSGFRNLTGYLSGNETMPTKDELDTNLFKLYAEKSTEITEKIKAHSVADKFSLSIETWQNIEQKRFINIYYNYVCREPETALNSILFKTFHLKKSTEIEEAFNGLHLKNCRAALVNVEDNEVSNFLSTKDIAIVPCFETIIIRSLQVVFKLPSMIALLEEITEFFEKNEAMYETNTIPEVLEQYPWTKYNLLKFFYDNVSWTDDSNEMLIKAKGLIDCITPLKITLETLADEQLPLNSLVRPLATKLMEQYFCAFECDIEIVLDVKEAISQELTRSILNNEFFMESAFLDPRFQHFIDCDGLTVVKNNLNKKFNTEILDEMKPTKQKVDNSGNFGKKSSLTLFFTKSDQKSSKSVTKNNFSVEIAKYVSEVCADLEQCTVSWWEDTGYVYRNLRRIADKYTCIPCCMNSLFKKNIDEFVEFSNRRFILRGKYVPALWFLHYNKDC